MSESYVECLVKRPVSIGVKVLRAVLVAVAAVSGALALLGFSFLAFVPAAACGAGAYFVIIYMDIEYEYLYLDKEITIDKVFAKSKRKRAAVFETDNIEMLAPLDSWHLSPYQNRNLKVTDYSSGVAKRPEQRYAMIMTDGRKIILEPSAEMIRIIKLIAPRKVFTD